MSCQKSTDISLSSEATVSLDLQGATRTEANNKRSSLNNKTSLQEFIVPFGDDKIVSVLIKESGKSATTPRTVTKSNLKLTYEKGTHYRVLIFDDEFNFLESKDLISGTNQNSIRLNAKDIYNIFIYSLGEKNSLDPLDVQQGVNWNEITLQYENNEDFAFQIFKNISFQSGNTDMKIVLKHAFTSLSATINTSSSVGAIQNVGDVVLHKAYKTALFNIGESVNYPLNLKFTHEEEATKLNPFIISGSNFEANSNPLILYTNGEIDHNLTFKSLTINGITKTDLQIQGLLLEPGIAYQLDITIKSFTAEPGFEYENIGIGWAPGNLAYRKLSNGEVEYYFVEPNQTGDYWYFNMLEPAKNYDSGQVKKEDMPEYSIERDPCSKVSGGKWRTPSTDEYQNLIEQIPNSSTNWEFRYNGVHGAFFGSKDLRAMSQNPSSYLFFPALGDNSQKYWMWESETASNAKSIQFSGYNPITAQFFSEEKTKEMQIRCIRYL
ncbi:MAG: hypothetical protein ACI35V_10675 [Sphingobacterium composti]